jgi:hypothetical protein
MLVQSSAMFYGSCFLRSLRMIRHSYTDSDTSEVKKLQTEQRYGICYRVGKSLYKCLFLSSEVFKKIIWISVTSDKNLWKMIHR